MIAFLAAAPFVFADFTWLNGNPRTRESPLDTPAFTAEFRVDASFIEDLAQPRDHTLSGSSESGRTGEFQVQQLGVGGDFHVQHVLGRVMTQFGLYSTMTPRNDPSTSIGQWDLATAYRSLSEAWGGYEFGKVNVEAGIFMSYVGLFSYYNFDNWAYQPSYVSSNTPWFFNGLRVQVFPSDRLKLEFWLINGWQSYASPNGRPGFGLQVLWRPSGWISILSNSYEGWDTPGIPGRVRWHTDDSLQLKLFESRASRIDRAAISLTFDLGCESGGGVHCSQQYFAGFMTYARFWFLDDLFGLTLGGGAISNPGRYLVLTPPINGATAFTGTPFFPQAPSLPFEAWDYTVTVDWMPAQFVTFRAEFNRRVASVPYFAGHGGMSADTPDLARGETRFNLALLVKI
jgi:hypothetical protein